MWLRRAMIAPGVFRRQRQTYRLLSTLKPEDKGPNVANKVEEKTEEKAVGAEETKKKNVLAELAPGVALAAIVMEGGFLSAEYVGQGLLAMQGISGAASPISGIPMSILLGLALSNSTSLPKSVDAGIKFATKPVLQAGIICVGAKLSALDLVSTGLVGLPVVGASIAVGLTFIPWFGNKMGLPPKMSSLIAAGTSICGVTAITALAPAIKASQRDTSFAVANVVAFGTLGMLAYPYVAHALIPTSHQIGMFLGCCVHDTSQVIGTALTYSAVYGDDEVLKVATVTKLTRNLFLAGVIPGLTFATAKQEGLVSNESSSRLPSLSDVKKYFPGFVAGFVGMSALRTTGDMTLASYGAAFGMLDGESWASVTKFVGNELGSHYLLGTAMAAVGLSTSTSALRGVGYKPFIVGLAGAGVVGMTGFTASMVFGNLLL